MNSESILTISSLLKVLAMVQGRDRRVELGFQLALNCRKRIFYPEKNKNSRFNVSSFGSASTVGIGQTENGIMPTKASAS